MKKNKLPSLYESIVEILQPAPAYLVGGAVRDLLLDRPIHDLDFALPENSIRMARKVADRLGGSFFVMDQERETCRVILQEEGGKRLVVDFTRFQGKTIEEDLAKRDFTITSLALDIRDDSRVIDPFQGAQDLKDGVIRATSSDALEDDPLRCLRAVRLASQLGFRILPETLDQIRKFQGALTGLSSERIRDELFRFLDGPNLTTGLSVLERLGLYSYALPGELTTDKAKLSRNLEALWPLFLQDHDPDRTADWFRGLLVHRLGRYRRQVREYLGQELVPGRSVYQLSFLLPLLSGLSPEKGQDSRLQPLARIPLSNQEGKWIEKGILAAQSWRGITRTEGLRQPVEVHRYFRQYGQAGVAAIFLGLAGELDNRQGEDPQAWWIQQLDIARDFLEGYWEKFDEIVEPPVLLDGNDILKEFKLNPGPEIGSLLESLREEQVRCGLNSREEGLAFLRARLFPAERKNT